MTREEQIFAYKELRNNGQIFIVDTYEDADRIIEALENQAEHDAKIKAEGIEELRVALQNKLHEEFTLTGADINEVAEKLKENK